MEVNNMKIWKKVNGFNNRYSVSSDGDVRNDERGTLVKPMLSTSGYHYVHLVANRKKHTCYVHRLVGNAFIDNPNNYPQVDHIDGCKTNNHISNLRWVSVSQNHLAYGSEQRSASRKRSVLATHLDGTKILFKSRQDAAKHFDCSPTKIKYNHLYTRSSKKGWTFEQV